MFFSRRATWKIWIRAIAFIIVVVRHFFCEFTFCVPIDINLHCFTLRLDESRLALEVVKRRMMTTGRGTWVTVAQSQSMVASGMFHTEIYSTELTFFIDDRQISETFMNFEEVRYNSWFDRCQSPESKRADVDKTLFRWVSPKGSRTKKSVTCAIFKRFGFFHRWFRIQSCTFVILPAWIFGQVSISMIDILEEPDITFWAYRQSSATFRIFSSVEKTWMYYDQAYPPAFSLCQGET